MRKLRQAGQGRAFEPANRTGIVAGHVEPDTFIINDVVLRIPPTEIHVDKQAFNHKWVTLRTQQIRQAKSGHSVARVSFELIFSGAPDMVNLVKLVAGLRATPFCTVRNDYLEKVLGRPDNTSPNQKDPTNVYKTLQPIMLGLTSMSFTTLGHEGRPGCVRGTFDFIWFNYLPFTQIVAYKTGDDLSQPGTAEYSDIWQAFYAPFLNKAIPAIYPHQVGTDPKTTFMWREFLMVPKGDPAGMQAALDLVNATKKNPNSVLEELKKLQGNATLDALYNNPPGYISPSSLSPKILDVLYKNLVNKGIIQSNQDVANALQEGSVTSSGKNIVGPALQKISNPDMSTRDKNAELDAAANLLAEKLNRIRKAANAEQYGPEGYKKILDSEAKYAIKDGKRDAGGMELWGRKRTIKFLHQQYGQGPVGPVIQQITVSFENNLVTIPMVGYCYPVLQHMGGVETKVGLVINARNFVEGSKKSDLETITNMYDTIETMALQFRQIPQGLNNIYIKNDFLQMFGISECIIGGISTSTIPGQPGRTLVSLDLSENGLTSDTRLEDNPEGINQEFINSDSQVFKECWKSIKKYLVQLKNNKNNFSSKTYSGTDPEYYFLIKQGIPAGDQSNLLNSIVSEAASNYNQFVLSAHKAAFDNSWIENRFTKDAAIARLNDLLVIQENDGVLGYIPNYNDLKDGLSRRNVAQRGGENLNTASMQKYYQAQTQEYLSELKKIQEQKKITTDPAALKDLNEREQGLNILLYNRGMSTGQISKGIYNTVPQVSTVDRAGVKLYQQRMRVLFDKVVKWGIDLGDFNNVKQAKDGLGLTKGLFAYPDYKPQVASVASWVEGKSSVNNSTLMKYEPDCYFWYPTYDGGQSSPFIGLIDPLYLAKAKKHSLDLHNAAQKDVGDFFSTHYLAKLKGNSNSNPLPYESLKGYGNTPDQKGSTEDRTHMPLPLYDKRDFLCSTYACKDSEDKGLWHSNANVDPSKAPANWSKETVQIQEPQNPCMATTDLEKLWEGADPLKSLKQFGKSLLDILPSQISQALDGNVVSPAPDSGRNTKNNDDIVQLIIDNCPSWLPANVALGVCQVESGFNPNADNGKGFKGLFQIGTYLCQDRTTKGGYRINSSDLFDPTKNTQATLRQDTPLGKGYLMAKDKGMPPSDCAAVAYICHNMGRGPVIKAFSQLKSNPTWTDVKAKLIQLNSYGPRTGPKLTAADQAAKYARAWEEKIKAGKVSNAQRRTPTQQAQKKADKISQETPGTNVTATTTGVLPEAIKEFEKELLLGQGPTMMRAYPAFKLYFIEDDSGERKRLGFDDFFSYNAVQSIRVVRSRKIAADLCEIYLTNVSGVLSNRRFRQDGMEIDPVTGLPRSTADKARDANGNRVLESPSAMKKDTKDENPIASLLLQEGIDIHLRLGYSSDPDRLDTVFNGTIVEIEFSESDDLVRILAQSHAIELVQDIKGVEKADKRRAWAPFNWTCFILPQGASTAKLLSEMISSPEVVHFGRWKAADGMGNGAHREVLTDRWIYNPQPQDDNIFAPSPNQELKIIGGGRVFKTLSYIIYRTTIWDIFQEMTLRHPNFIASPVPYEDKTGQRMTMFFGLPNQYYFYRHPRADEELADEKIKQGVNSLDNKTLGDLGKEGEKSKLWKSVFREVIKVVDKTVNLPVATTIAGYNAIASVVGDRQITSPIDVVNKRNELADRAAAAYLKASKEERLKKGLATGWIKPFRNYHLVTSKQHIIANNINASSRDVANTIIVKYGKKVRTATGAEKAGVKDLIISGDETFILKQDCALPPEETRAQICEFINVDNEELAKRYAIGMLIRNLKEIYKGELIILGNGKIKPYDIVYIFDEYTDMIGAVEVGEVQHVFDQQMGFRTEIKPDMFVQSGEWSLLTSAEALGVMMEGWLKRNFGPSITGTKLGRQNLSILPWTIGQAGDALGGFISNKIITYTQLAMPVVMSPILHHGRPFAGGIPTRKLPVSFWTTVFGKWSSAVDAGYQSWLEDIKAQMVGWITTKTGNFQQGDFFNNGEAPIQ